MTLLSWIRNKIGIFRKIIVIEGLDYETYKDSEEMIDNLKKEGYDVIILPEDVNVWILDG